MRTQHSRGLLAAATLLLASSGFCTSGQDASSATLAQQAAGKFVFAHFIMGTISNRASSSDWDIDMRRAKYIGIDAFALNIGIDESTDEQLGYAYASAADNGLKVFISFDFNWWKTSQGTDIGKKIAQYANETAQLKVDDKVFASSFAGDGVDVSAIRAAVGTALFWAPNVHPSLGTDLSTVDGALNWAAWPSNDDNQAPTASANVTVKKGDDMYISGLGSPNKYIAPASPWFSTHYGPEVEYPKNFVLPGDLLWFNRWLEILSLGPRFVEILTWNDYGESHYVGPLSSPHDDDGNSKWTNDMPHDGWMDMAAPFISAYKAGASSADSFVESDKLVYWYRPTLKSVECGSTDTTMEPASNASGMYFEGQPNGYNDLADSVFVVSLLTSAGTIKVKSGSTVQTFNAQQGISAYEVPMSTGQQQFSLSRSGKVVLSGTSLKDVSDICPCGIYNFNAYVGTLPESYPDPLQSDGLSSLTVGLHVTTCLPKPSLSTGTAASSSASDIEATLASAAFMGFATPTRSASAMKSSSSDNAAIPISSAKPGQRCAAGTGSGNYAGLCKFACKYGYCPSPCTCTSSSASGAVAAPSATGSPGYQLFSEDQSYAGLCAFSCPRGYCPSEACTMKPPTASDGTTTTPLQGRDEMVVVATRLPEEDDDYLALRNYACNLDYCP